MTRLAGTLRIAPPHAVVPWEIRKAIVEILGLQANGAPELDIFGSGVAHAMAISTLRYTAPDEYGGLILSPSVRQQLQDKVEPRFEEIVLAGATPEGVPDERRVMLGNLKTLTDDRFVHGQEEVMRVLTGLGRHRLDAVMLATAIADIMDPLLQAANELAVPIDAIFDADLFGLIDHIPSRWVEMMLRRQRQANPQKAWHGNDLNDVTALSIAVPYCDVVVTERSWSSMLNAAKVPDRFGTLVTPNFQDLVRHFDDHS